MALHTFMKKTIGKSEVTRGDVAAGASLLGAITIAGLIAVSPGIQDRIAGPFAEKVAPIIDEAAKGSFFDEEPARRIGANKFDYHYDTSTLSPSEVSGMGVPSGTPGAIDAGRFALCDVVLARELC